MTPPTAPPTTPWHAGGVGKGLLLIATVFLLEYARALILPIAVAVVLTFLFSPVVRWLRHRGLPEFLGAGVLVTALLGATALSVAALAGPAAQWWERAPATIGQLLEQFDRVRRGIPLLAPPGTTSAITVSPGQTPMVSVPAAPADTRRSARAREAQASAAALRAAQPAPPPPRDPIKEGLASEGMALTRAVLGNAVSFGVSGAATVILLYFLLASEHWMLVRTVEALPRRRTRALVLCGVRSAQRDISRFVGTLALVNLGVALCTVLAMRFLDLPNPVLWGAIAGVLNFIPYIGPLMTMGLLLLAGIASFDPVNLMLAPAFVFLLIHTVEANFVTPWFVGRQLSLSPLAVFLSVMFWGWLWGITGALIAVPLLVGLRSICKRNRRWRLLAVYLEGGSPGAPTLRSLLRVRRRRGAVQNA